MKKSVGTLLFLSVLGLWAQVGHIDFQKKYNKISDNDVKRVLEEGRKKVDQLANEKMAKVRKLIGVR